MIDQSIVLEALATVEIALDRLLASQTHKITPKLHCYMILLLVLSDYCQSQCYRFICHNPLLKQWIDWHQLFKNTHDYQNQVMPLQIKRIDQLLAFKDSVYFDSMLTIEMAGFLFEFFLRLKKQQHEASCRDKDYMRKMKHFAFFLRKLDNTSTLLDGRYLLLLLEKSSLAEQIIMANINFIRVKLLAEDPLINFLSLEKKSPFVLWLAMVYMYQWRSYYQHDAGAALQAFAFIYAKQPVIMDLWLLNFSKSLRGQPSTAELANRVALQPEAMALLQQLFEIAQQHTKNQQLLELAVCLKKS